MAVRRLAPDEVQPASFAFTAENAAWAEEFMTHYPPGKQASCVIPFLMRAQDQDGWVSKACIEWVADKLGMAKIRVLEVATFYTQFQLVPVGKKAHVQVCGTTPCMLRGSDDIIKVCKNRIHHEPHHLSADGDFSWEEVECLGACVNAPMVAVGHDTYEDLTPETFNAVLDAFASGVTPVPGPQNGKAPSVPEGGPTTLTDPGVYNGSYRRNIALEPPPAPVEPAK
jgi:NADH-quinone oxidoreductase subunit E